MPFPEKQAKAFIDPARGDPEAAALAKSAAALDWSAVESALRSTTDRTRREFLVDAIALRSTNLTWVDRWVRQRPDESLARLMYGACAIQYAWHVRSGAEPRYVPAERIRGFHEWLGHAEDQLQHATTMDRTNSSTWIALIWSAVGLGLPLEEATSRWETANELNPASELAALAYTTFLSPRWNGSHELMWNFIRNRLADEPEGTPQWALVPDGHLEQWVADRMAGDAAVHASKYFQQADVQRDINDAYRMYLASPARRSSPLEPQNRELFACAFYLMGARDLLRNELERLGPGIQTLPWGYLGSPLVAYQNVREWAGLR